MGKEENRLLMLAAADHHQGTTEARAALASGAKVNEPVRGETALHCAARYGKLGLIEVLVREAKARVDAGSPQRQTTPLMATIDSGHVECARLLLDLGADIEARDYEGRTPLLTAAHAHSAPCFALLLGRGADINATDNEGRTALMLCMGDRTSRTGYRPDIASLLLTRGSLSTINATDNKGFTVLMMTVTTGWLDPVIFFLERGADPAAKNHDGHTALDQLRALHGAIQRPRGAPDRYSEIIALLEDPKRIANVRAAWLWDTAKDVFAVRMLLNRALRMPVPLGDQAETDRFGAFTPLPPELIRMVLMALVQLKTSTHGKF